MAAGFALIVLALLPIGSEDRAACVITLLLVTVATPVLYSFLYWRRSRRI